MASLSLKNVCKVYPNGFEAVKDFNLEHHFPPIHQCLCRIALIRELIAPGSAQSLLLVSTPDQKKLIFLYPQISLPIIPAIAVY